MSLKVKPIKEEENERMNKKLSVLDENLPMPHFVMGINSTMGAGKTTLILNLIKFYNNFFDDIYYFSPTAHVDDKFEKIKFIPETYSRANINVVIERIKEQVSEVKRYEKEKKEKGRKSKKQKEIEKAIGGEEEEKPKMRDSLLIFDDASANKNILNRDGDLSQFIYAHRHFRTSIIIVSHYYTLIPKAFRSNLSVLVIFDIKNIGELRLIMEENALKMSVDEFKELFAFATSGDHDFLMIDKKRRKYFKNFNEIVIS